ncbi:NnrS family protein [Halomonas sp. ZH2S]|uniref:NnrS family protein n=1 Tax=Vreelandella zhuhanensis TaxID=2684210 RepID=A0A7X3GZR4_9GAMM|nr:NnrS family protein [Halomonas zhuhanensis]MWJ27866.1 NnrS family protein [Halomonas zhuhanensis]
MQAPFRFAQVPLLGLAFRPFFLLGAAFSIISLLIWLAFWHGIIWLRPYGGLVWWHQHEMIFGFAAAIIVGFLLSAVQNWTGKRSLHGGPLLGLVSVWLAARLLLAFPMGIPAAWLIALDVAFLPLAAVVVGTLVVSAKRWRNLIFLPVLTLLALANLAMHLGWIWGDATLIREAAYLAVLLIGLLMVVLGGRVIPFFTSLKLGRTQVAGLPRLEAATLASTALVVVLQALVVVSVPVPAVLLAALLLVAAVTNGIRLARWESLRTRHEALLWGLHLSYAFIVIGLGMWALALLDAWRVELAVHALTIGAIGAMMLAMISRVSLGHTGRPIRTLPGIGWALALLFLAAVLRAPLLAVMPQLSHWVYSISILAWCMAYGIFLVHYTWPLVTPRKDGKEG